MSSTVLEQPQTTQIELQPIQSPVPDPDPPHAQDIVERWNHPRSNIARLAFAFLTSIVAGMNDAVVGALLPSLESYYGLTYAVVSLIFLTPFVGYSLAAFTNARIHSTLGQRGIAILAPTCHIITYTALSLHPPWPVLVVCNAVSGFGNGLTDACFCAWVGSMDKANAIQGLLHSCFSIGALLAPLVATSMLVRGLAWYTFYYIMLGISVLELIGLTISFWPKTGAVYLAQHQLGDSEPSSTRAALKSKVTWLCSLFYFAYMGAEIGLGGWIVTFMLRVRHATPYASGLTSTGFWTGMALGRACLGFVTEKYGERLCLSVYLALSVALQLLFWLVPQFVVSAVAVAFLGFFLGPLFPGAVMLTARLLPRRMHVSAIGFAMAVGGVGGTVFPFGIGAIAGAKGVGVLQPVILALLVVVLGVWIAFPKVEKRE